MAVLTDIKHAEGGTGLKKGELHVNKTQILLLS